MTVSFHNYGDMFFPGTGDVKDAIALLAYDDHVKSCVGYSSNKASASLLLMLRTSLSSQQIQT